MILESTYKSSHVALLFEDGSICEVDIINYHFEAKKILIELHQRKLTHGFYHPQGFLILIDGELKKPVTKLYLSSETAKHVTVQSYSIKGNLGNFNLTFF